MDLPKECNYIVSKALAGENTIVILGCLVFVACASGDAFALDVEDRFACPLCLEGEKQPYRLLDAGKTWAFHWPWKYFLAREKICFERIDGGDPYVALSLKAGAIQREVERYNRNEGSKFHL